MRLSSEENTKEHANDSKGSLEHKNTTQNKKSVQAVSKQKTKSRFAKTDVRYWHQVILHADYTRDGIRHFLPEWSVKVQHGGRRETFGLGTPNRAAAAEKARQIYLGLKAEGWDAVLARFKRKQSPDSPVTTVGQFLGAVEAVWSGKAKTLADYARAFRTIVADIFGVDGGNRKYDYRSGGREAWLAEVNQLKLRDLSPQLIQKWKIRFLKRAGNSPAKRQSAATSVNSLLRQAKSLFAPRVLKFVPIDLPAFPFEGVQFEPRSSARYQSAFKVEDLIRAAQEKLPLEQFKIFLLALMAGLRRNEIDKLEWNAFNWDRNLISIRATEFFQPKSEDSTGDVEIDFEVMELFRGFKARASGTFVIECSVAPRPGASYSHYRCQRLFEKLGTWLRAHGVEGKRPLHTLRKEYGSQVCAKHGIYAASRALRHADIAITSQFYLDKRQPAPAGLGAFLQSPTNVVSIRPIDREVKPGRRAS